MKKHYRKYVDYAIVFCLVFGKACMAHEAKDFDDTILYKIDFEMPNLEDHPLNQVRTFYTHEKEKYDCVIPAIEEAKEVETPQEAELSPIVVLQPLFSSLSCSYRIEVYWSYEICHGAHVRQYHEEREGKNLKSQEYMLGYNKDTQAVAAKTWEENRKAGKKYKTIKIDNIKYPYYEVEMRDGSLCDIIEMPRTTIVKYVCYIHGKNEIYSFKETATCNYEAIILTPTLCIIPAFRPEESKEVSIKCFNSPTEPHKPLSMLRQELNELQPPEDDFPISKETSEEFAALARTVDRYIDKFASGGSESGGAIKEIHKLVVDLDTGRSQWIGESSAEGVSNVPFPVAQQHLNKIDSRSEHPVTIWTEMSMLRQIVAGTACLTGGTGWWKYEFCYGRHVRQFHKDKKSETELFLGYFNEEAHKSWLAANPSKNTRIAPVSYPYMWHHYEKGTHCDRTNMPRDVDVKLNCGSADGMGGYSSVSMYLLEPKTCHYILVVESPMICDLLKFADDNGLVSHEQLIKVENSRMSEWKKKQKYSETQQENDGDDDDVSPVSEAPVKKAHTTSPAIESVDDDVVPA